MGVKDAGVHIRVEKGLRDQLLETCCGQYTPAAQVLRQFMRENVAEHGDKPSARRYRLKVQGSGLVRFSGDKQ
jgi:hypothetical protein